MQELHRGGGQSRTEESILAFAAVQHGVVSRSQVLAAGFTDRMTSRRLAGGAWVSVHSGVYRLAARPETWRTRCMAACLALGPSAVASHRAAGALWGLDACAETVEVTVLGTGERRLAGVVVHRTRVLGVGDRTVVDGIPVTRPVRTLIDLAGVLAPDALEAALDSAFRDKLATPGYLERRLVALGSRGRTGVPVLQELLGERREGRPADSRRENDVARALKAAGLPGPVRQFQFEELRFDLAYPDVRIAVEFDSYRHHYGRQSWRRDRSRHNRATAAGWLVFHVTDGGDVDGIVAAYRFRAAA